MNIRNSNDSNMDFSSMLMQCARINPSLSLSYIAFLLDEFDPGEYEVIEALRKQISNPTE